MIIVITFIGLLFVIIGRIVTLKNAKNLLSGYNTMSQNEKLNIDIVSYVTFFKQFHYKIGILIIICGFVTYFVFPPLAVLMMIVIIFSGYSFFIWKAQHFQRKRSNFQILTNKLIILFLMGVQISILVLFYFSVKDVQIKIDTTKITILGMPKSTIFLENIAEVKLIDTLPSMLHKTKGFAVGSIFKGIFVVKKYGKVNLQITDMSPPYLYLSTKDKDKYIISFKHQNEKEIYENINTIIE